MDHEEKGNEYMITLTIEAYRKRPLTRPAQLEAIIKRFGLVPRCEYTATGPLTYVLNESIIESNNGAELTVELGESDAPKALDIVRELRCCGFVSRVERRGEAC
jgi:hypothetical protein